ncbi:MAG: hypothetical protein ACR2HJ_08800 [Fimbriimonadales bacterium]
MTRHPIALALTTLLYAAAYAQEELSGPVWSPYGLVYGIYDNNADRDESKIKSRGFVYGVGLDFKNNARRPTFEFSYETAVHNYSNFDRFDRTSHSFSGVYHHKFSDALRADLIGEVAFKGSSDDRDVNDIYSIQPRLQYRFSDINRLNLRGNYRLRRPADDPNGENHNRFVELGFERRMANDQQLELAIRYEINRAKDPNNHYIRRTMSAEYKAEASDRDKFSIEIRHRPRTYTVREVEPGVLRFDNIWVIQAGWERLLTDKLALLLDLRYETRRSNDEDRNFNQAVLGAGLKYRW